MSQTEQAVRRYQEAHVRLHGEPARILSAENGWIRIGGVYGSHRPKKVYEMADRLRNMARNEGIDRTEQRELADINAENARETAIEKSAIEEMMIMVRQRTNDVWDVRSELKKQIEKEIDSKVSKVLDNDEQLHTPVLSWKRSIKKNLIVAFLNRLFEDCGNSAFDMERAMNEYAYAGDWILSEDDEVDCSGCDYREEHEYLEEKIEHLSDRIRRVNRKGEAKDKENTILKMQIKKLGKQINELKKNSILFTMDDEDIKFDVEDDIPF